MAGPQEPHEGGLAAFADDEEKAVQLKRHLKDRQELFEEREQRRRKEELQLVEQYKQFLHQERISKKEALSARLNKLKSQAELQKKQAEAKAEWLAASASQGSGQEPAPAGNDSTEAPGKEVAANAAATKSARGKQPVKSPIRRSPRQDSAGAETGDALLAKLNESRGFRQMLDALENRDVATLLNKKPVLRRSSPEIGKKMEEEQGEAHLEKSTSQEGQEGKDKPARTSQHHMARRYRLRTMEQVATEVLRGKKQLSGCFEDARHHPAMMAFN